MLLDHRHCAITGFYAASLAFRSKSLSILEIACAGVKATAWILPLRLIAKSFVSWWFLYLLSTHDNAGVITSQQAFYHRSRSGAPPSSDAPPHDPTNAPSPAACTASRVAIT